MRASPPQDTTRVPESLAAEACARASAQEDECVWVCGCVGVASLEQAACAGASWQVDVCVYVCVPGHLVGDTCELE